ncbi:MAG: hypothetical protein ACXWA3_08035, partial [Acidimicrobiales bacterium]
PRPAVGARIGPEAPVVLAVTYTSTVEHPVVAGDIVIDYRAGRRRLSIGLDTSICVRPSPVPDMVCPELR